MTKTTLTLLVLLQGIALGATAQSASIVTDKVKMLNPGNGYLNSVNTRAIRDFVQRYENATDVFWYGVNEGFIVRFLTDSLAARSAYQKNGYWVYTIISYEENKMPKAVRHLVKGTYYDYSITLVEQIEQPNEPVQYVVHLQDAVSWKNVLVANGHMDLIEDKKKL